VPSQIIADKAHPPGSDPEGVAFVGLARALDAFRAAALPFWLAQRDRCAAPPSPPDPRRCCP
jgi:hypothetical protein